jgi:LemA protein
MTAAFAIVGLIVLVAGYGVVLYNRLVALRNRFRNAFSLIDVQLRRRHDLIPNVVATAKAYLQHERGTLEAVIAARAQAMAAEEKAAVLPGAPAPMHDLSHAEIALTTALAKLIAVAENYPQLKANETMAQLFEELTTTENRIALARQAYNDAVMFYNTACQTVPSNFIAVKFQFAPAEFLETATFSEKEVPKATFS